MNRFLESLLELCFPTRCAGCELPGDLLCAQCDADMLRIEAAHACPSCGTPYGRLVCTECWQTSFAFEAAVAAGELESPLSRAIVLHKDAGERRLAELLGRLIAEKVADSWPYWADRVAYVPATRAAIRRRGFDHALAIASATAAALELPLSHALSREAAADQRSLGRFERISRARGSFSAGPCSGKLLVVDDVLTTGATLDAAAAALLDAGADAVRVAVVARAW